MEILKFTLCGKTAFFKKPDVNNYVYYTFGHIHKVALLGLIGAVLGYDGYQKQAIEKLYSKPSNKDNKNVNCDSENSCYPEFYKKLKDLKIGVVPVSDNGIFPKRIQQFNNTTCFASIGSKYGQNLIVTEQWLENPAWDIYIILNCDEAENIKNSLCGNKTYYTPYLGTNDHMACIQNVQTLTDEKVKPLESDKEKTTVNICSLFQTNIGIIKNTSDDDDQQNDIDLYKYEEYLPVGLDDKNNLYTYEKFTCTNMPVEVEKKNCGCLYKCEDKIIAFY